MLSEEKRTQLDGIVQQMVANGESDDSIKFVVNDFKTKYALTQTQKPKKDLLQKTTDIVTSIFPGEKLGESIGTAIAASGRLIRGDTAGARDIMATQPTVPQILGEGAAAGLDIASMGGAGLTGKFTTRLAKSVGLGAGIAASTAVAEGEDIGDVEKAAIGGGVVGAAIPIAGAGIRAIGRAIDRLPDRLVNSAFGKSKIQIASELRKGKQEKFSSWVLEKKGVGTASSLYEGSKGAVKELGEQIQKRLSTATTQAGKQVTVGVDNFLDDIVRSDAASAAQLTRENVKEIITTLAPETKNLLSKKSLNLVESNKLAQLVTEALGDRAYIMQQSSFNKKLAKGFAYNLREIIKTKEPSTRKLFLEQSREIELRDLLLDKLARRGGSAVLTTSDIIGGGLGSILGGMLGNPVLGVAAGVGVRRTIESVPFKLSAAKTIQALTKAQPVLEQLTPAQQTTILNLFSELFNQK